ncbi:UDP-glucose 4-epimerase [Aaosphaeria arxii CBS 175.79]|uniref:UDP-glucose 4-epimerase n=1 Tax=Aaosphaeria arxii CBS 175.79 TaxID=1450172 RepID=A0A6A5XZ50_9PLEO|nr:UDP-glucose 4-epimerase [Aaosphaeria arxii CBS 175.79]KAF2017564.1 UDP-glucose 4-epimerase [Aaosphaeria arxii CBS 175.79]
MEGITNSGTASPSLSMFSLADSNSAETVSTPDTQRSLLFDDDVVADPLDIAGGAPFIMVIGGLGYIGSHTVLELLKENYNVLVIDDLSNSYESVLQRIKALALEHFTTIGKSMPSLHFRQLDYRSPCMRSVLASYSTYSVGNKMHKLSEEGTGALSARFPFSALQRTDSGIDLEPEDAPNAVVQRTSRISGVIHFAAYKSVEESIRMPLKYYSNNVCGMVDFLGLLEEFGIKNFVFSSSATVYGEGANCGLPLREELCVHHPETFHDDDGSERHASPGVMGLTSPYGRSKFMCESILADIARSDPSWSITALRYFNPVGCHESGILGEDPRQKPSNLIPVVATVLTGTKPVLDIFGTDWSTPDGTAVRDFIHVVDLAQGHIAALAASASGRIQAPFRAYNLGTGRGHTVREVVQSLETASERKIPVRETDRRAGDVGFCVAEVRRAETELQWRARKTLADCSVDVWNFTKARCNPQTSDEMIC